MTVSELIKKLKSCPQDATVLSLVYPESYWAEPELQLRMGREDVGYQGWFVTDDYMDYDWDDKPLVQVIVIQGVAAGDPPH